MYHKCPHFSIAGTMPVGDCCICDLCDSHGNLVKHVDHFELFKCQRLDSDHWACAEHFIDNLCYGCYLKSREKGE